MTFILIKNNNLADNQYPPWEASRQIENNLTFATFENDKSTFLQYIGTFLMMPKKENKLSGHF